MDEQALARELNLFREALQLPTVGMVQVGELEQLQELIHRYPAEAKRYVDELYGWKRRSPARPVAGEGPRGPDVASRRAGTGCD